MIQDRAWIPCACGSRSTARCRAQEEAERLAVSGFARNEPDGTVAIECEGPPEAVERLRAWCESGPAQARVERIETVPLAPIGDTGFRTV